MKERPNRLSTSPIAQTTQQEGMCGFRHHASPFPVVGEVPAQVDHPMPPNANMLIMPAPLRMQLF